MNILVQKYMNYLSAMNKSEHTIKGYAMDLRLWIDFQFKTDVVTAKEFEAIELTDLYDYLNNIKHKADATKARAVICIKNFYKFMKQNKLIAENNIEDIKTPNTEKKLPKYLSENESVNLINSLDTIYSKYPERDYAILTIFLNCGLRLSELIGLNKSDIREDSILIRGKGKKQRQIPLNQMCVEALENHFRTTIFFDGDAVFVSSKNQRMSPCTVTHLVKKYLGTINKEDLSPHSLRHTFASLMLSNQVNLRVIQDFLGHESLATTQKYTHINNEDMKRASDWNPLNKVFRK